MTETIISARFGTSEQMKAAIDRLARIEPTKADRLLTADQNGYEPVPRGILGLPVQRLLMCCTLVGTVIGAVTGHLFLRDASPVAGTMIMSSISYAAVGGAAGLLIGGFFDVIFQGSLDDRKDEPEEFVISLVVEEAEAERIIGFLHECSAANIVAKDSATAGSPVAATVLLRAS